MSRLFFPYFTVTLGYNTVNCPVKIGTKRGQMGREREEQKIRALTLLGEGLSVRQVADRLGVGKTTVSRWQIEYREKTTPKTTEVPESRVLIPKDSYANYVGSLRTVKDRQIKWAGAITETGIRSLKVANRYLAIAESKANLTKDERALIRLAPILITASANAIKTAAEAEDRALALERVIDTLNEFQNQVQNNNLRSNPGIVVADNPDRS